MGERYAFHVGTELETFDDDATGPAPCGCAACLEKQRLREMCAKANVTRVTTIHAALATAGKPYTVYLEVGASIVEGRGESEESAIDAALVRMGTRG